MPTKPDLVTTAEACQILNFSHRSTLTRRVQMGQLEPAMRLPGKQGAYLFRRRDVEALAKKLAEAAA